MSDPKKDAVKSADQFGPVRERFVRLRGEDVYLAEASYAAQIIAKSDQLMRSTPASKQAAVINVANTGLSLSPVTKLAFLVPRYNSELKSYECHLEPSYRGLAKLITDTGSVRQFITGVVYEGDTFSMDKGKGEISHVPAWSTGKPKGKLLGVYSVATMADGSLHIEDMDAAELEKIRECSDAYVRWKKDPNKYHAPHADWQDEMDRKAVLRRHVKTLPLTARSVELDNALAVDEAGYSTTPRQEDRLASLRRQIREALEFYQGEDRFLIQEQCRAKLAAGEFTIQFAEEVLRQLGNIDDDAR